MELFTSVSARDMLTLQSKINFELSKHIDGSCDVKYLYDGFYYHAMFIVTIKDKKDGE